MRIKRILNFVKVKVSEYPRIDSIVESLEEQKETSNNRDINSFIRSKNRINRNIEFQAMKNIDIDNKIEEYRKWQSIIKEELKLIENTDNETFKIIESRLSGATFEKIQEELYLGHRTVMGLYNNFIMEVTLLALKNDLISIQILKIVI